MIFVRLALFASLAFLIAFGKSQAASHDASAYVTGIFALQGGRQHATARLTARTTKGATTLDIAEYAVGSRTPIRGYDVDMTKRMHVIVVTSDLRNFRHVHPSLNADGHLRVTLPLRRGVNYEVYADAVPRGFGRQVFRFPVHVGQAPLNPMPERYRIPPTADVATVGPYRVRLSARGLRLDANQTVSVRIDERGHPAHDLRPYLGTFAHDVFVRRHDLTYAHVHAMPSGVPMSDSMADMEMPGRRSSAEAASRFDLDPHLVFPGSYTLWLQFNGNGMLYVAPFSIAVR